jgi:hypothetical protein
MSTSEVRMTIKRVKEAKEAYFATGSAVMPDDEYDALEAIVRREGGHEGLAVVAAVGFQKKETGVPLPHVLPSLSKIKPGEKSLARFLARGGPFVVSEKLDGVSALWIAGEKKLYNRGNGVLGTSITEYAGDIQGLAGGAHRVVVRGEICLRRAEAIPGSPARSQVNGWLHRTPEERSVGGAPALRFIAYQVIEPAGISRAEQFAWLAAAGFEVPWNKTVRAATEETLATWLQARRTDSPYDTDGIVIGTAGVPEPAAKDAAGEAKDPSDAVAFKMPLAEQCAETTVRAIEWNAGKTGMLIPRISIEPVVIGSAQIAWVTGHNAKFISDGGIGPGARVLIRRSGDVIPIVDSVLEAVAADLPPAGTWKWNSVHAEPLKQQDGTLIAQLLHSLKVLEVEGGGPAAAKAAFDAGVETIRDIIEWDEDDAVAVLGKTKGPQLIERTRAALEGADTFRRICACPCLGTGIGTRRIKAVLDHYDGHIDAVCKEDRPPGWGEEMWEEFVALTWPEVLEQLDDWTELAGEPAAGAGGSGVAPVAAAPRGDIVFTGVRDKALEAKSVAAGWTPADTVKKTTKVLIIPDSEDPTTYSTGKAAKARDYGVEIVRISTWRTRV